MEKWNKRGAGRVKVNSSENLDVCALLKLDSPPSRRRNASCSPLENLSALHIQRARHIKKLDIRFPTDF